MLSTSILPIFALSFTLANAVVISGGAAVENLERRYGYDPNGRPYPDECSYGGSYYGNEGYCGAPPVIGYPVNGGGYSGGYYNNYEAKPASDTDQKVEARGLDVSVEV